MIPGPGKVVRRRPVVRTERKPPEPCIEELEFTPPPLAQLETDLAAIIAEQEANINRKPDFALAKRVEELSLATIAALTPTEETPMGRIYSPTSLDVLPQAYRPNVIDRERDQYARHVLLSKLTELPKLATPQQGWVASKVYDGDDVRVGAYVASAANDIINSYPDKFQNRKLSPWEILQEGLVERDAEKQQLAVEWFNRRSVMIEAPPVKHLRDLPKLGGLISSRAFSFSSYIVEYTNQLNKIIELAEFSNAKPSRAHANLMEVISRAKSDTAKRASHCNIMHLDDLSDLLTENYFSYDDDRTVIGFINSSQAECFAKLGDEVKAIPPLLTKEGLSNNLELCRGRLVTKDGATRLITYYSTLRNNVLTHEDFRDRLIIVTAEKVKFPDIFKELEQVWRECLHPEVCDELLKQLAIVKDSIDYNWYTVIFREHAVEETAPDLLRINTHGLVKHSHLEIVLNPQTEVTQTEDIIQEETMFQYLAPNPSYVGQWFWINSADRKIYPITPLTTPQQVTQPGIYTRHPTGGLQLVEAWPSSSETLAGFLHSDLKMATAVKQVQELASMEVNRLEKQVTTALSDLDKLRKELESTKAAANLKEAEFELLLKKFEHQQKLDERNQRREDDKLSMALAEAELEHLIELAKLSQEAGLALTNLVQAQFKKGNSGLATGLLAVAKGGAEGIVLGLATSIIAGLEQQEALELASYLHATNNENLLKLRNKIEERYLEIKVATNTKAEASEPPPVTTKPPPVTDKSDPQPPPADTYVYRPSGGWKSVLLGAAAAVVCIWLGYITFPVIATLAAGAIALA